MPVCFVLCFVQQLKGGTDLRSALAAPDFLDGNIRVGRLGNQLIGNGTLVPGLLLIIDMILRFQGVVGDVPIIEGASHFAVFPCLLHCPEIQGIIGQAVFADDGHGQILQGGFPAVGGEGERIVPAVHFHIRPVGQLGISLSTACFSAGTVACFSAGATA